MSADRPARVRTTPEFPELVISDDGRIQGPSRKWLKPFPKRHGYLYVTRYLGNHRYVHVAVHTAVCTAFNGPRPEGCQVRHLNGRNTDNRAENLAWGTGAENQADRLLHGTDHRGVKQHLAKVTEADVREIRRLREQGLTRVVIGQRFGITPAAVGKITTGKTWGWLT